MCKYNSSPEKSTFWRPIEQALLDFFRYYNVAVEAAEGESSVSVLLRDDTDNLGYLTVCEFNLNGKPDAELTREIESVTLSDIARAIADRLAGAS